MATRDVALVIKAKDEASRALNSIAAELDALIGKQTGLKSSGAGASATIAGMVAELAKFEKVSGLVTSAADRSEAAITRQRQSIQQSAAALAAVSSQIASAQRTISSAQAGIVDTRLAGGDTTKQVAGLQAMFAEVKRLEGEQRRLGTTVAAQTSTLSAQESAFRETASMATSAANAVKLLGDENARTTAQMQAMAAAAARANQSGAEKLLSGRATVDRAALSDVSLDQVLKRVSPGATTESANPTKAVDEHAAALQRLLDRTNPAAAIQRKLADDVEFARKAMQRGSLTAGEFAKAEAELTRQAKIAEEQLDRVGKGAAGKIGLFGLKPYELTNLGYQVNDVFTGLASGQAPMQIIAQQGGQILQLMPKVGSAITAAFSNPYILTGAATFGAIAFAIKAAADQAERLRQIQGTLDASASGLTTSAGEWDAQVKGIERYGVALDDAMKITKTFFTEGLNPKRFEEFGRTAKDMADVLGIEVTDAAKQMAEAFSGGYEAIAKLDDAVNFMTAAEREHIRTLYESGKAGEARAESLRIFEERMNKGAAQMRGPWTEAVRGFTQSWNKFATDVGNTWWAQGALAAVNGLAEAMKLLTGVTDDAGRAKESFDRLYNADGTARPYEERRAAATAYNPMDPLSQPSDGKPAAGPDPKGSDPNSPDTKRSNDTLAAMAKERELQKLREEGARAIENLRFRGESFLTTAEQRRRTELAGELAATRAVGDQRVKDAARAQAIEEERTKIRRESDSFEGASSTPAMVTRRLIQEREGFIPKAKWDVNHYRVGFGSDTTTSPGGAVGTVTKGTTVTLEGALRDLDRRIAEFQNGIKSLIGADRFGAFNAQQQAALTSVAYNYGTLGKSADGKHGAGIADTVRTGTVAEIAAAIRGLAGQNGGINRARRNREADLFSTPNAAVEDDNQKQALVAKQRQDELNASISRSTEERQRQTAEIAAQNKLTGEALVQQQIKAAGDKAVADLERQTSEKNANLKPYEQKLVLSEEQLRVTRATAEAEAQAAQAQALANAKGEDAVRKKDGLVGERDAIAAQIEALRTLGDESGAQALVPHLQSVNAELLDAIDNTIALYKSFEISPTGLFKTQEELNAAITALQTLRIETQNWHDAMAFTAKDFQNAFAGSMKDAFKGFAKDIAEGKNVFESLGKAVLSFAATFLEKLADMGLEVLAFKAASALGFDSWAGKANGMFGIATGVTGGGGAAGVANSLGGALAGGATDAAGGVALTAAGTTLTAAGTILTTAATTLMSAATQMLAGGVAGGGGGGGIFGAILGVVGGALGGGPMIPGTMLPGIYHSGGLAGMPGAPTRAVSPAWFTHATRYHGGGLAGLAPDEVPAILRRREEILRTDDPRHRDNAGGSSGGGWGSAVLAVGDKEIASAMSGVAGEDVTLLHLRRNIETVRQWIGGNR